MTEESLHLPSKLSQLSLTVSDKEKLLNKMISNLTKTEAHFKHQQRGEPDLTQEEKSLIALDILNKSPTLFLERFSRFLTFEDTQFFSDQKGDYLIDFYIEDICKRSADGRQHVVKNRRFQAMQILMDEGEYFSENEMKWRDPLLYEQMVGQYISESEKEDQKEQDIDRSDLRLSSILLKHMDMQTNKQFCDLQKENEEMQEEEEEESDEEITDLYEKANNKTKCEKKTNGDEDSDVSETERSYFRSEFLRTMQEKFLSGGDTNFDYSKVDNNADFDALDIVGHDAEEKYFDADEDVDDCDYIGTPPRREIWLAMSVDDDERDVNKNREGSAETENC